MSKTRTFGLTAFALFVELTSSCGGSVVETPEADLAGAAGTGAGGSVAGQGGDHGCSVESQAAILALFVAATECDPSDSSIQCSGQSMMTDPYGCQRAVNVKTPQKTQAALDAFEAWIAAQCPSKWPPLGRPCSWPASSYYCEPEPSSGKGFCRSAASD